MDEDVTTLTDEELNEAVGTGTTPEPESPTEEPVVEEPVEEPTEEPIEELPVEEPVVEEQPVSRREQLRIQQLLTKYPDLKERVQTPPKNEFIENLDADPEVIRQLTEDRNAQFIAGAETIRAEMKTSEWNTMLNIDTPQVLSTHKWLNPKDTENFQPAIADAVNAEYLSLVGYDQETGMVSNPGIRYSDFIEARVELSTRLAKAMTAESTKNIVKQTASTGLRPDGSSAKRLNLNQAPQNMTDEELYAAIGQKAPKK